MPGGRSTRKMPRGRSARKLPGGKICEEDARREDLRGRKHQATAREEEDERVCIDCTRRFCGSFVAVRLRSCDDRKQERELAGCEAPKRERESRMLKKGSWKSANRKLLGDISNGGRPSRDGKTKIQLDRDDDGGYFDRLILVRSTLSLSLTRW
ncbi:hypothetical protein KFK09_008237 [Dendrobium nobile]|uniref:Uncharacterized protein n=1 Tax=Dendrobium nobile TaxID=94219 RepID=A0A8T3BN37_DENNO|nr:hypothetical protein KFK09_008237 [Dendrobium nobile]